MNKRAENLIPGDKIYLPGVRSGGRIIWEVVKVVLTSRNANVEVENRYTRFNEKFPLNQKIELAEGV